LELKREEGKGSMYLRATEGKKKRGRPFLFIHLEKGKGGSGPKKKVFCPPTTTKTQTSSVLEGWGTLSTITSIVKSQEGGEEDGQALPYFFLMGKKKGKHEHFFLGNRQ